MLRNLMNAARRQTTASKQIFGKTTKRNFSSGSGSTTFTGKQMFGAGLGTVALTGLTYMSYLGHQMRINATPE